MRTVLWCLLTMSVGLTGCNFFMTGRSTVPSASNQATKRLSDAQINKLEIDEITFETVEQNVLSVSCNQCHNAQGRAVDFTSETLVLEHINTVQDSDSILSRVQTTNAKSVMPPANLQQLQISEAQKRLLVRWIEKVQAQQAANSGGVFKRQPVSLTKEARLRKLSLHLRGMLPSKEEYAQISTLSAEQTESFLANKAAEYTASLQFNKKMTTRLLEDIRIPVEMELPENNQGAKFANASLGEFLSQQMISQANWNELLTGDFYVRGQLLSDLFAKWQSKTRGITLLIEKGKTLGFATDTVDGLNALYAELLSNSDKFISAEQRIENLTTDGLVLRIATLLETNLGSLDTADLEKIATYITFIRGIPTIEDNEEKKKLITLINNEFIGAVHSLYYLASNSAATPFKTTLGGKMSLDFNIKLNDQAVPKSDLVCAVLELHERVDMKLETQIREAYNQLCASIPTNIHPLISKEPTLFGSVYFAMKQNNESPTHLSKVMSMVNQGYTNPDDLDATLLQLTDGKILNSMPSLLSHPITRQRFSKTRYSRSAALHRIYFCDDMTPVALVNNQTKTNDALKKLLLMHNEMNKDTEQETNKDIMSEKTMEEVIATVADNVEAQHVKESCLACHRKLDPAETLLNGKMSSPLAIVYDDHDTGEQKFEIKKGRDFLAEVTKQPQYLRCQTQKFWNWIIGEDIPMSAERREQLMETFTKTQGSPQQLVQHLVSLPEFHQNQVAVDAPTFQSVQAVLKTCHQCHSTDANIPNYSQLPFVKGSTTAETTQKDHAVALEKLIKRTDLFHGGAKSNMPPVDAGWVLGSEDRERLLKWIYHQARNDDGQPTLTDEETNQLFAKAPAETLDIAKAQNSVQSTFGNTWRRYYENYDLWNAIFSVFSNGNNVVEFNGCFNKINANKPNAGFNDQLSGLPVSSRLTRGYREVLGECAQTAFTAVRANSYFDVQLNSLLNNVNTNLNTQWSSFSEEQKYEISKLIVIEVLGPILPQRELARLASLIQKGMNTQFEKFPNISTKEIILAGMYLVINDGRFLGF